MGDFLINYFLINNFCASNELSTYDEEDSQKWAAVIYEVGLYFEDGTVGGWSSNYCSKTWNDESLKNEADLEIFDLLLKIDIKNGADPSKIARWICSYGAFEAVKVKKIV